jgi:hypothetical protein
MFGRYPMPSRVGVAGSKFLAKAVRYLSVAERQQERSWAIGDLPLCFLGILLFCTLAQMGI